MDHIELYGGNIGGNIIPGAITSVTVQIGGVSAPIVTTPFGPPNAIGVPFNDSVDLAGAGLSTMGTNTVTLLGFQASFFGFPLDQFSISEIVVFGRPAEIPIAIDIKPDTTVNPVNLTAGGTVPVAILSTPSFDAPATIDTSSLTFGRTGTEPSLVRCGTPTDVNHDRLADLVCHFNIATAGFHPGDEQGTLRGSTLAGLPVVGTDTIRVVP